MVTPVQVQQLLASAGGGVTGLRNRALIALLYRAGLRVGEVLVLRPIDLDARKGTVYIDAHPSDRGRYVALDDFALGILAVWLEARMMLGHQPSDPLFCVIGTHVGSAGKAVDSSYVRRLMSRLGKSVSLGYPLRAQTLRDSHAAELQAAGMAAPEIMRRLGRASLRATERYLAELAPVTAKGREPTSAAPTLHGLTRAIERIVPGSI